MGTGLFINLGTKIRPSQSQSLVSVRTYENDVTLHWWWPVSQLQCSSQQLSFHFINIPAGPETLINDCFLLINSDQCTYVYIVVYSLGRLAKPKLAEYVLQFLLTKRHGNGIMDHMHYMIYEISLSFDSLTSDRQNSIPIRTYSQSYPSGWTYGLAWT